jgi:HPt (histidine-containing phosphotransfer) domain-containing protein
VSERPEPVLDSKVLDRLRQLTAPGEPDVLVAVLHLFLQEVPRRLATLRAAWAAGDAAEVLKVAHSLKGSAGNVGAQALFSVCRQLDDAGRTGGLTGAQPLVDALDVEYARVEVEIRRVIGV